MSTRRGRNIRAIRGPQSALTDFLASHNISAREIRDSFANRLAAQAQAEAEGEAQEDDGGEGNSGPVDQDDEANEANELEQAQAESSTMATERTKKRKRDQQDEAIAKIKKGRESRTKASKEKEKEKKKKGGSDDDSDYDIMDMYKKTKPLPGQLANCEICDKRFTVTPYSKNGPDGGLLCTPCGKTMAKETKAADKSKNKPTVRKGRRKMESNRLDGITFHGAKTLQQLCIEKLAKHAEDIDEFGDMPEPLMKRLSEIFSKKRATNSITFKLFLQPGLDAVTIHEAAYLNTEDFSQIFAIVPTVKRLQLGNCCQFKDSTVDYMIEKANSLEDIRLGGANLVSNDKWIQLFSARGEKLKCLKLEWLDAAFDNQAVAALVSFCPNLERLKLERCKRLDVDSINAMAEMCNLKHLTLRYCTEVPRERLVNLITNIGSDLRTLCLENFMDNESDPCDDVLEAIHSSCRNLAKFRFTENTECTDKGYFDLFTEWANPPLRYVDLNSTRDLDNANPDGPEDLPIGLGPEGFKAIMAHSGSALEYLDVSSCRHIPLETLYATFDGVKKYPHLREMNLSFCPVIDTVVLAGIFRSCPAIEKVVTFGCFDIKDVVVPRGILLIGAPRVLDAMEQLGDVVMDFQREMLEEAERDSHSNRYMHGHGHGGAGRVVPVMS